MTAPMTAGFLITGLPLRFFPRSGVTNSNARSGLFSQK
jgi:hypothetical protein